ncbi:restriction endonuclease subunit S, partial [Streptococcus suis]|nr:restriction endonuclease subunit S [Streptococcus suis]HEM3111251.1 restriction endonuclease subunit S [Streptococcus suis]HEM3137502.1 restriction endonuclease subunit S [Streptococcus suis]HEM3159554.1 restriction endonuclease subunit S [Streptococcus suis]
LDKLKNVKQAYLSEMFPAEGERVPKRRFPGFTDAWELRKLGELGTLKNGMNFSKDAMGIGFPFINLQNIFGKNIVDVSQLGLAKASSIQLKNYNLQKGDVLFVRSSVKLEGVGEAAIVPKNLENTTYSGFIIRYRDSFGLDYNFKRFIFGTSNIRNQIMSQATDSANKNISQQVLTELDILVPPLLEQNAIGTFFSILDQQITLHQRKLEKLKNLKKALLNELFV